MDYTDTTAVSNYLLINIDGSFSLQLAEWIAGMSRHMDQYCGRTLVSETPSTRKFDGNGRQELVIDEVNTINEVRVSDTVVTPLQYPANTNPKYQLVLESDLFPAGRQNVEVDGIFAKFAALPLDLKFACTVLVAGIVNANKNQNSDVKSERIGQYTITFKDEQHRADYLRAMQILGTHKRITF